MSGQAAGGALAINSNKVFSGARLIAFAGCIVTSTAWAQSSPVVLEQVIVTAQKREESVQDVPISISTVSGDRIDELAMRRIEELQAYIPNFTMSETALSSNIGIRGFFSGANQGFAQSVGTYMDGVYRGRSQQTRTPFLDLARVEVLRGSQNTLFGRNSIAGALNMTSAKPTREFEASVDLFYEPEFDERALTAVVSGPLGPRTSARLAFRDSRTDGYLTDLTLGGTTPQRDDRTIRGSFAWEVGDRLDIGFKLEMADYDVVGRNNEIIADNAAVAGPFTGLNYSQILVAFGQDPSVLNTTQDYARSSNGDYSRNELAEAVLTIDYSIGNLSLTAITAHSGYEYDELCDCDFTGGNVFSVPQTEDFGQFSQEVRIASPADQDLRFIAGLYYETSDLEFFDTLIVDDQSIILPVVDALTQSTNGQYLANTATPRHFDQKSTAWSAFAQGTWRVTDRLRVTAGLRVTDETSSATRRLAITDLDYLPLTEPAATVAPLLYAGLFNVRAHAESGRRSETLTMPSVTAQFQPGEASMAYVTIARGEKAGGFDPRSNNPVSAGGGFEFRKETAINFEAGTKRTTANGRADFSMALFRTNIEDMQVSTYDGVLGYNVTNAGEAVSQGFEFESRWAATSNLTVFGSLALTDFEFREYIGQCYFGQPPDASDGINCNYAGKTNQYVPDYAAAFGFDYSTPIRNGLELGITLDVQLTDDYFRTPTLDPMQVQPAYTLLNARVSIGMPARGWELALIGRNLTDRDVVGYSIDVPLAGTVFGAPGVWGFVRPPRTIAMQGTMRF